MPLVYLSSLPATLAQAQLLYGLGNNWALGFIPYPTFSESDALSQMFDVAYNDFVKNANTAQWGTAPSDAYKSLKFCDPGLMMQWIDTTNAPTQWQKNRGVEIIYKVRPYSELNEWRRPL